jgi:hypothetical protein
MPSAPHHLSISAARADALFASPAVLRIRRSHGTDPARIPGMAEAHAAARVVGVNSGRIAAMASLPPGPAMVRPGMTGVAAACLAGPA